MSKRTPNLALEKYPISDEEIQGIAINWVFKQIEGCKNGVEMEVQRNDTILNVSIMRKEE